jgi:retron-type reverse transcriptase
MAKLYRNLWPNLISFENLLKAYRKAARGKRSKPSVALFEYHLEENLFELQTELREGSYQPGAYINFYIHDPKHRLISAAPFRDRVVHHALINIMGPIYERKFIFDSYANRKGKGSHRALDRATTYMRRFDYVLPLDVRQYFPSIDHAILLDILRQTFDDQQLMALAALILEEGKDVHTHTYDMVYFAGDDLLAMMRPRGLPIGNMTSQFWANVYLNGLDHYIKRVLGCKAYIRYVDDMPLFANNKKTLHQWRAAVIEYLASLRLTIHEECAQPRPCERGLPFLGFQLFADHRRLKRRNPVNARRRIKRLSEEYGQGDVELSQVKSSIQSWIAHAEHGDTWGLRGAILEDIYFSRQSSSESSHETIPDFYQNL